MPFNTTKFEQSVTDVTSQPLSPALADACAAYATASTPLQKARCVQALMAAVDEELGPEQGRAAMARCACIGQSVIDKACKLQREAASFEDLLAKMNAVHLGGGHLQLEDTPKGRVVHAAYDRCYCGSVSKTKAPISATYCACSCGWFARLFEALVGHPVEVELLSAVIQGAERCTFAIYLD